MRCSQLVSGKGGRARKCRNQAQNGGYCWQHGEQSYASSTYHQNGAGYEEIYNYQTPSAGSSFGKFLAKDKSGMLVFLSDSAFSLEMTKQKYPSLNFHYKSEF